MQWGAAPYNLSLQRKHLVYNLFCCPECKEDFGSKSVLDKHKNKYDVYDNILEDFADIPFKLSDRIGQNLKDLDGEEDSEHEYDPKKEFDSEEEINQLCHNTETEKLLIEEKCLECSICNSTFRWQNGLRAHVKSMLNEKFNCEQCQWSFRSFEKLKEHIDYLH
mgnify:FL=1